MGRRQRAGRDLKIQQGQRRDAYFAKIRRKSGGAPPTVAVVEAEEPATEESTATEASAPAESDAEASTEA